MNSPPKKVNTTLLEGHVKEVITSAKSKITDLGKDIQVLEKDHEDVQNQVKQSQT
jgi:hypothetical protein